MSFAVLQAAWAGWLLDGLIASGVCRAVVSPGSRSTPFVLAVAKAEAAGRLSVQTVIDERAAAFFALGQARVTGEPTLLVCTSGTAGAHYLPAIVEAAESRLPLLVLTADRPPELRGRGASQTIEQSGMFGRFVRRAIDIGPAEADARSVDGLLRTGALAVHAARWPEPGPVHLNVAFRKPLEPDGQADAAVEELSGRVRETLELGLPVPVRPERAAPSAALAVLADRVRARRRGMLILGPCGPDRAASAETVERLARATGYPVLAEATSQHRFGPGAPQHALDVSEPLFGSPHFRRHAPKLVLQIGAAPTGRALGRWIAGAGAGLERIVIAPHGVPEAFNQARSILLGDLEPTLEALAALLESGPGGPPAPDGSWLEAIESTADRARTLASDAADRTGSQGETVRAAVEALPEGGVLIVGNSMPVRDVDLYLPAVPRGIDVLCQRGAAGIDGLIAGAAGAVAAADRPTLLLLGDVSFQHDVGGLAAAAAARSAPLVIVVIRNGGGRLFELLPVHDLPGMSETFQRYFLTPPGVDAAAAAAAFDLPARRVAGGTELRETLESAFSRSGATLVEAEVAPDGVETLRRITAELDAWLAGPESPFAA